MAGGVKLEDRQTVARRKLHPFELEFAETFWWWAYSIGKRNHFWELHRVSLTGDACQTYFPKAGQDMNVSLREGYNICSKMVPKMGQGKGKANDLSR